jgi:AbiV family abortive infection protein
MTDKPHRDSTAFLAAVDAAIEHDKSPSGMLSSNEFDLMATHVAVLVADAVACFDRKSYGTCVFLSVTALEETAKAEMLGFRGRPGPTPKGGRDPMLIHAQKHKIAVRPTTFFGRLPRILGNEVCARLQREAENGELNKLREQALYVHLDHTGVTTPATAVDATRAREILLLALETADDVLVGWTNASMVLGERFDAAIERLSSVELSFVGRCEWGL